MTMKLIATQTTIFGTEHKLFVAPAPQNHPGYSQLNMGVVE
jgi:hypothetical protein